MLNLAEKLSQKTVTRILFFLLFWELYIYVLHSWKQTDEDNNSCHTVAFVLHGYIPEISSISMTKIEDLVLLGINEKKKIAEKKSQWRGQMVQLLALPMFHENPIYSANCCNANNSKGKRP